MPAFPEFTTFEVNEATTPVYSTVLEAVDAEGVATPIIADDLTGLTLTVVHALSGEVVNGRDEQDVLQANGVTVGDDGTLTWQLTEEDTEILEDSMDEEPHRCLFRWTYETGSGEKSGAHEVMLIISNLPRPIPS